MNNVSRSRSTRRRRRRAALHFQSRPPSACGRHGTSTCSIRRSNSAPTYGGGPCLFGLGRERRKRSDPNRAHRRRVKYSTARIGGRQTDLRLAQGGEPRRCGAFPCPLFTESRRRGVLGSSELLRRAAVLSIFSAALALEPVLVLLAVGHGGAFEGGGLFV
jgi:hypothetical protein